MVDYRSWNLNGMNWCCSWKERVERKKREGTNGKQDREKIFAVTDLSQETMAE